MAEPSFDAAPLLKNLTHRPGVYRMLGMEDDVIYVGKARDLKKRVASYFSGKAKDAKTMRLVSNICDVEVTVTRTETEALILEHNLIKKYRPKYNVLLRDDKSFPWIYVETEHDFPRTSYYRGSTNKKGRFFGPYPNAKSAWRTLHDLQKLFRIRGCEDSYFSNRTRPCLQYQIERCTAPCVGLISKDDYAQDLADAMLVLQGRDTDVVDSLIVRMEAAAEKKEYETAAQLRDQIARLKMVASKQIVDSDRRSNIDIVALSRRGSVDCIAVLYIRQGRLLGNRNYYPRSAGHELEAVLSGFLGQYYLNRESPHEIIIDREIEDADLLAEGLSGKSSHKVEIREKVRGDRARWLEMASTNAEQGASIKAASHASVGKQLMELGEALELDNTPRRLECFDISHTQGEATLGSCVVFDEEGPLKAQYRRFNSSNADAGDDYGAMREAVERRYKRVQKGEVPLPDVLFIDGGKGQLSAALGVLDELGMQELTVVAVAKGRARKAGDERLFLRGRQYPIILSPESPAALLIQQIRDEAHRFAITGHRMRRGKARTQSRLERIAGLGPKRRRELLKQFGGLQGVKRAGVDDLVKVQGISQALAERIYQQFHDGGEAST